MLCLLINLEEKIVLTDSLSGTRVEIKPYLRTKSGTPELQFAFDAPPHVAIAREKIRDGEVSNILQNTRYLGGSLPVRDASSRGASVAEGLDNPANEAKSSVK